MLTRALIVMLVVLNLGVAAWWIWRPDPAAQAETAATPSGIARLQLLQERKDLASRLRSRPAPAAAIDTAATTPADETPPSADRCFRFGPFADDAALATARTALQPRVARLRTQSIRSDSAAGWRVIVPPAADREAANALAERIKQAGFPDLYVVGEGAGANSIVLGQFSNEDRARQHAARLQDAGFAAEAQPLGEAKPPERWVLVAATAEFDSAAARRASGATQANRADCAALR
jgi:hypothetical protein